MTTVPSVGCSSSTVCSAHRSVLAKAQGEGLGKGWFLIASLQLHNYNNIIEI